MGKFHTQNIKLFETNKFDKNKKLLFFYDVLHLIKRGIYALLNMIYSKKDYKNKIEQLKKLFNIPQKVLNNTSYTKMHDILAVKLFSLDNLCIAYNNSLYSETFLCFLFHF